MVPFLGNLFFGYILGFVRMPSGLPANGLPTVTVGDACTVLVAHACLLARARHFQGTEAGKKKKKSERNKNLWFTELAHFCGLLLFELAASLPC